MKAVYERELRGSGKQLAALRQQLSSLSADLSLAREECRVAAAQRDRALKEMQAFQKKVSGSEVPCYYVPCLCEPASQQPAQVAHALAGVRAAAPHS